MQRVLQTLRQARLVPTLCAPSGQGLHASARADESSPAPQEAPRIDQLSTEQVRGLADALAKVQAPLKLATRMATLAALSVLYRDMHLTAQSIHSRQSGSPNPLVDESGGGRAHAPRAAAAFPMNDTSKLPDSEAPSGLQLEQRYMDKITCWHALQPNHMETSHQLLTGINLFPPQEATYPTYVDFDAVIKGLEQHKSRKRLKLFRKLRQRQDKYQLKVWDHYPGHQ